MIKSIRTTERNTLMLHELEYPFDSEYILKKIKKLEASSAGGEHPADSEEDRGAGRLYDP